MTNAEKLVVFAQMYAYQQRRQAMADAREDTFGYMKAMSRANHIITKAAQHGITANEVASLAELMLEEEEEEV